MKHLIATVILTLCCWTASASAEPATSQPLPSMIAKSDVAAAALRFEAAYEAHPPASGSDRARIHQAYDQAWVLYYSTKHAEAIQTLNELTDSLGGSATTRPAGEALIHSLQVRVAPPIARHDRPSVMRIRVARMYNVPTTGPVDLRLVIRSDEKESKTVLDEPVRIDPNGPPFQLTRAQPKSAAGRYLIELIGPDGTVHPAGRWWVIQTPLDAVRLASDRSLAALRGTNPEMIHALAAGRSRMMLLSDQRDENNPVQFLTDPILLCREVQSEADLLSKGKNPYTKRAGELWRAIVAHGMDIPARVYAPPQVQQEGAKPMPLVIAMHDGGGDESIFMQLFGNGKLKKLADQYGFVVVTPNSNWVMRNMASLDSIVEAMSTIYPIDSSRVYLIGHGSGVVVALNMAAYQPEKVAKVVLFSGGDFTSITKLPPTLLYAGELDPLFRPELADAAIRQAQAAKLPVEPRERRDSGHTLIVHDNLGEAVEWLMK